MSFRSLSLLVTVALPAFASGSAEELRALVERRLAVIDALRNSNPRTCTRLIELSHAIPSTAVLSRLRFSRADGRFEFVLSQGTEADAKALVTSLVTAGLCATPVTKVEGTTISASCVMEAHETEVVLPAPKARPLAPRELEMLRERLETAQLQLPDVPQLDQYNAILEDVASRVMLKSWASKIGPAVRGDGVDRFDVSGTGSSSFHDLTEFICALEGGPRSTSLESFTLEQPRVRNGEWVVDFSMRGTIWRYRPEDELKEVRAVFKVAHQPAPPGKSKLVSLERSPFGAPGELFAGAPLVLTGKECRQESAVLPPTDDEFLKSELDDFAVVFVAPKATIPCAMLVDASGACRQIKRNTRFGPVGGKVTQIDTSVVTVTHYSMSSSGDGKPYAVKRSIKVRTKSEPPSWFCKQK